MTQSDEEPQAKTSQTHHLALKQALGKVWWGRRFRLPGPVIPQCYNRAVRSLPAAALALATILSAQTPSYDLIVRHGRIIDGTGGPWSYGDIGIRGDSIASIGDLTGATAAAEIDATGLVVAPGFLDIHTHARRGIFTVPTAENYVRRGVTTLM